MRIPNLPVRGDLALAPGLDLRLLRAPSFSVMFDGEIGMPMVCRLTGLTAPAIARQLERGSSFPKPCGTTAAGRKVWRSSEVRAWAEARKGKQ